MKFECGSARRLALGGAGLLLAVALGAATAAIASASSPSATPTTLVLPGRVAPDEAFHAGTFTGQPPICAAGSWLGHGDGTRTFTCEDGSGTFFARFDPTGRVERQGGSAPWQIESGTGRYAELRGKGTGTAVVTGPSAFTNTWQGMVDFDARGPAVPRLRVSFSRSATKLIVRVTAVLRDDQPSNVVNYRVNASAGASAVGRQRVGAISGPLALRYTLPRRRHPRTLRLDFALEDPVGNRADVVRVIRLPRN